MRIIILIFCGTGFAIGQSDYLCRDIRQVYMRKFRFAAYLCLTVLMAAAGRMPVRAQDLEPYRDWFGSYGFTDSLGNIVIECRFDDVKGFTEGYAPVLSRGGNVLGEGGVFGTLSPTLKWGYIDTSGMIVIPCQFDLADQFSEGYAAVMSGNKWGFIDHVGDTLVSYKYDEVRKFVNGYAAVRHGQKWGYIDTEGQELVPCVYDVAGSFGQDGFAAVTRADSSGFVFRNGNWYATKDRALNWIRGIPFSIYAKDKMMNSMNEWQRLEPGESVADWEARVNDETFMARLDGLELRFGAGYLTANQLENPECLLGDYDSLAGTFAVSVREGSREYRLDLMVPAEDTASVRSGWKRARPQFSYFINNDRPAIAGAVFTLPGRKVYEWKNPEYDAAGHHLLLDYDLDDVDFTLPGKIYRETLKYVRDSSVADTDSRLPDGSGRNTDTYAIVIANEHYLSGESVSYALNDGKIFCEYCRAGLGIPDNNIRFLTDARAEDIRSLESWLDKEARVFNVDTRVIVYYSGKCAVDDGLREVFLLPVDYVTGGVQGGLSLNSMYSRLLNTSADNALFLIDASYGKIDRDGMRSDVFYTPAVDIQTLRPAERMVTFYAAGADEGAYPYPQKRHGLFTYFLLKALQDHPGISYGELFDYISANVERVSEELYGRIQEPEVYSSEWDGEAWRDFTL